MSTLSAYDHNDTISLSVKLFAITKQNSGKRAYKLTVVTKESEKIPLIIWNKSPAADLRWRLGNWYQIDDALVKHWPETTELNATTRTTAKRVSTQDPENDFSGSAIETNSSTTNRCQYTWTSEQQDSPSNRSHCCYRPTWRDFNRCIWHAETSKKKPATELEAVREHPDNRILNRSPRELLSGAKIQNAELTGKILTKVDLSGAELVNTNLRSVYLQYANFSNANLRGADITQNKVSNVSFRNANLENADLSGLSLYQADFTGAELSNAVFTDANVNDADFNKANIEYAIGISDTEPQSNIEHQTDQSRNKEQGALNQDNSETNGEQSSSNTWNVDSLAAATTLGTNDIENSIARLTTAGCSQDEALWYIRRYLTEMLLGDGLFAIYSVGPSSGQTLVEAGITTVEELLAATPQSLSQRTDLSTHRIQTIQGIAKAEKYTSLEPDDKKVAEQLLKCADSRHSFDDISSDPNVESDESKEADRTDRKSMKTTTQESAVTTSSSNNLNDKILTPSELIVPIYEEHTTPDGDAVFSNYLSEYYEAFYSAKNVLSRVFQIPGTDIDPEDRTDPRVQYYILLDACIGFGDLSTPFAGYGPQHQDRLPFSMQNYRTIFGDSERVTDYQVINVKQFGDETHELLRAKTDTDSSTEFVRPCVPGTKSPIPELPGSFDELQQAAKLLNTFPAYPPLPTENGVSSRTVPITEIYETCFEDLDPEYQIDSKAISTPNESPPKGPVTDATPKSATEAESKLVDYGKLSHLFQRITPPTQSHINRSLNVFALNWYRQSSANFGDLTELAKYGEETAIETFRPRLQDLIHRRFLLDDWDYDYITVFPSHKINSLSPQLVQLAQDAVLETKIIYTPLLERTKTVERQRDKSRQERHIVAIEPEASLRVRSKLDGETVILFDDICTTGSSLAAGAHLLRQAGAERVVCLTLGLTPGGPLANVTEVTDPGAVASNIIAGVDR